MSFDDCMATSTWLLLFEISDILLLLSLKICQLIKWYLKTSAATGYSKSTSFSYENNGFSCEIMCTLLSYTLASLFVSRVIETFAMHFSLNSVLLQKESMLGHKIWFDKEYWSLTWKENIEETSRKFWMTTDQFIEFFNIDPRKNKNVKILFWYVDKILIGNFFVLFEFPS